MAVLKDDRYNYSKCELEIVFERVHKFNYGGYLKYYDMLIALRANDYCVQAKFNYLEDEVRKLIDELAAFSEFTVEDLIASEKRIISYIAKDYPPGMPSLQSFYIMPLDPGFMFYLVPLKITNKGLFFNVIVMLDAGEISEGSSSSSGPAILLGATHKNIGKFVQDMKSDLVGAPQVNYNSNKDYLEKKELLK